MTEEYLATPNGNGICEHFGPDQPGDDFSRVGGALWAGMDIEIEAAPSGS